MTTSHADFSSLSEHGDADRRDLPDVVVRAAITDRNRLTCAFRPLLALPHLIVVGGPAALAITVNANSTNDSPVGLAAGTGLLGGVVAFTTIIAWFVIVFGGRYPEQLRTLAIFYMRWRVHAVAYVALLSDRYPSFGVDPYPADLVSLDWPSASRRLTVAFRLFLALPHLICLAFVNVGWCVATVAAWICILFTGRFPQALFRFSAGVLQWNTRVETYLLLLHDEFPPFELRPHLRAQM